MNSPPNNPIQHNIWCWIDSGPSDPAFNMALDEALLEAMPKLGHPVLRFYGWSVPAASFGYFQRFGEVQRLTPLRPLIRRPTGGGIVPHDADWTYSLAIPPVHSWYELTAKDSYCRMHQWIQQAFQNLELQTVLAPNAVKTQAGQCFAGYEESDLLWRARKIAGAAQRRRRDGLLIQGSVQPPDPITRKHWQQAMLEIATANEKVFWQPLSLSPSLSDRTNELVRTKYSLASYNEGR